MSRFPKTYCSQCGGEFGPGNHGYSHCEDHSSTKRRIGLEEAQELGYFDADVPECANGCAAPMACSGPDKCALIASAPKMPDDYWLHARCCDCEYCAWERAGGQK